LIKLAGITETAAHMKEACSAYIHTHIQTYIETISEMRCRISCLALRRSAIKAFKQIRLLVIPADYCSLNCDIHRTGYPKLLVNLLLQ